MTIISLFEEALNLIKGLNIAFLWRNSNKKFLLLEVSMQFAWLSLYC